MIAFVTTRVRSSVLVFAFLILSMGAGTLVSGCGLLITAAKVSGKMPDTATLVEAAIRTGMALAGARPGVRTITAGEAVSGTISLNDEQLEDGSHFQVWFYTGTAGEQIQIDMWSDAFEPYLILGFMEGGLEGTFEQLEAVGEVGAGSPVTIRRELDRTGMYAIVANSVEPGQVGAYRLRVLVEESAVGNADQDRDRMNRARGWLRSSL